MHIKKDQPFVDKNSTIPHCSCRHDRLHIFKQCHKEIGNDGILLHYQVILYFVGHHPLFHVCYEDLLHYDSHIVLGEITVKPNSIKVDESQEGLVKFSTVLKRLTPRQCYKITYTIPIDSFPSTGAFTFNNKATAYTDAYKAQASCKVTLENPVLCPSIPVKNIACATESPYTIAQPKCQLLPTDESVCNPYYDSNSNSSFWTYELLVNCTPNSNAEPANIIIPLGTLLSENSIRVMERLTTTSDFVQVPFQIIDATMLKKTPKTQRNIDKPAVAYISIDIDQRFSVGVGATYRIEILGLYPEQNSPLYVRNVDDSLVIFNADYIVPGSEPLPRVAITKEDEVIIDGNKALIEYHVNIVNTSNRDLYNLQYLDTITYDARLSIGSISVEPTSVNIDTSIPGIIKLEDTFDYLPKGSAITILYQVPINLFPAPNTYIFDSATLVFNDRLRTALSTSVSIDVVDIITENRCHVLDNQLSRFTFSLTNAPNSPDTAIMLLDQLKIPTGITVRIVAYDECNVKFTHTDTPVPPGTEVTNDSIDFQCTTLLPKNGTVTYSITLEILSIDQVTTVPLLIENILEQVVLLFNDTQVYLGARPLPNKATLENSVDIKCESS